MRHAIRPKRLAFWFCCDEELLHHKRRVIKEVEEGKREESERDMGGFIIEKGKEGKKNNAV